MKIKLQNELDIKSGKKALELLKNNTQIFRNWNVREIAELSEYMRFLFFQKSTPLAKKNEKADYFGIIISGRALISSEGAVFGFLSEGDMIGYLNFSKVQGTETNFFDINGEKEGYLATIRIEDYKTMSKKSPMIAYKLQQIISRKSLDSIYYQYKNEHLMNEVVPVPSILPPKRIVDMFEKSPAFQEIIKRMEKRDRSNFLKYTQLHEFVPKDIVCRKQTRCRKMIFLLKGELTSFNEEDGSVELFRPGDIIGQKEFYLDLSWNTNILAKGEGLYLVLKTEHLEDIALENGQSAMNLYSLFANLWTEKIKADYEREFKDRFSTDFKFSKDFKFNFLSNEQKDFIISHEKLEEKEKEQQAQNEKDLFGQKKKEQKVKFSSDSMKGEDYVIGNFLEIDLEKKMDIIRVVQDDQKESVKEQLLRTYGLDNDVCPLYLHSIHKHYIENAPPSNGEDNVNNINIKNGGKQSKPMPVEGISILYREKLEKQAIAMAKLKQQQRQERKEKQPGSEQQNKKQNTTDIIAQQNEEYEELKNDLAIIDQQKIDLHQQLEEVKEENKSLRFNIDQLKHINTLLNSKVNKNIMQRELVSKDIQNQGTYATLHQNIRSIQDSFHTVVKHFKRLSSFNINDFFLNQLDQQLKLNRGSQLAAKCAYKWLLQTKRNLVKKKTISH